MFLWVGALWAALAWNGLGCGGQAIEVVLPTGSGGGYGLYGCCGWIHGVLYHCARGGPRPRWRPQGWEKGSCFIERFAVVQSPCGSGWLGDDRVVWRAWTDLSLCVTCINVWGTASVSVQVSGKCLNVGACSSPFMMASTVTVSSVRMWG